MMYGMSGDTQSRHCSWVAVSLEHNNPGQVARGGVGHSRKVRSQLSETIRRPFGLNATLETGLEWPAIGAPMGCPLSASHRRNVRSQLPETMW